jgi:hypothetical protein
MEALILTLDVAMMIYLCWRIFKGSSKPNANGGLGWLSHKKSDAE